MPITKVAAKPPVTAQSGTTQGRSPARGLPDRGPVSGRPPTRLPRTPLAVQRAAAEIGLAGEELTAQADPAPEGGLTVRVRFPLTREARTP